MRLTTVDGVIPSCEHMNAPEGLMGVATVNNDYVKGRIVITDGDSVVYDSGDYAENEQGSRVSGMRLRIRGNTSSKSSFPPYKVNLSVKADPLGMGSVSKDWLLLRPYPMYHGCTVMNNLIGRKVALLTGIDWQPDYRFVEVYLNDDYRGLYIFSESVERAADRVDVSKTGFIAECDAYFWTAEEGHWFRSPYQNNRVGYTFKHPKDEDFDNDPYLLSDIADWFAQMEYSLYNGDSIDSLISIRTFAAWHLAKDYLGDIDTGGSNMYMYKKNNKTTSKLKAGPLWDFDNCFRIGDQWHGHHTLDWMYGKQLFKRENFAMEYMDKYDATFITIGDEVEGLVDSVMSYYGNNLDLVIKKSNARCGTSFPTLEEHSQYYSEYFTHRLWWIDNHVGELFSGILTTDISQAEDNKSIRIYNMQGCCVRTLGEDGNFDDISLPDGIYVVKDGVKSRLVHLPLTR